MTVISWHFYCSSPKSETPINNWFTTYWWLLSYVEREEVKMDVKEWIRSVTPIRVKTSTTFILSLSYLLTGLMIYSLGTKFRSILANISGVRMVVK